MSNLNNNKQQTTVRQQHQDNLDHIEPMIAMVRKQLASRPKEYSWKELEELDPRLSDDCDF
jgi:hypothetical protein